MTGRDGYVYIVHKPGYGVKIGHTQCAESRFSQLKTAHGRDLVLVCAKLIIGGGNNRIERRAHAILRAERIQGEWFAVDVQSALLALGRAHMEFVIDDTPDALAGRGWHKTVDRGLGKRLQPRDQVAS